MLELFLAGLIAGFLVAAAFYAKIVGCVISDLMKRGVVTVAFTEPPTPQHSPWPPVGQPVLRPRDH